MKINDLTPEQYKEFCQTGNLPKSARPFRSEAKDAPEKYDNVNHPKHYKSHPSGIECIQITEHMGFCLGNAMKYIWRADHKNGIEDLEKAAWYIKREIQKRKQQQEGK